MSKSPKTNFKAEKAALRNAIFRCTSDKHPQYNDYGGRGITVHASFIGPDGFANFLKAIGPKPSPELTLDRVSNDKGYEPGNIAWTSRSVQQRNRRSPRAQVADLGWGLKKYKTKMKCGSLTTRYSPYIEVDGTKKSLVEWSEILGVCKRTLKQRILRGKSPREALVPVLFDPHGNPRRNGPTIH